MAVSRGDTEITRFTPSRSLMVSWPMTRADPEFDSLKQTACEWSYSHPQPNTSSPISNPVTAEPIASTTPATSVPLIPARGRRMPNETDHIGDPGQY